MTTKLSTPRHDYPTARRVLILLTLMALVVDSAKAQEVTPGRIELSKNDSNASRVSALRRDFTDAIVYGAPRKVIERLIDRRRQSDTELTDQLKQIVQQLAEIPKSAVDAKSRQISAKLKRARSLAWLARIELLSLQSECFASGSADAISTSQQTIELIGQAVSNLPNGSEVRGEVDRLLVEAHLHAGDGWSAQSATTDDSSTDVAIGPEKLALLIRIDLANQKLDEASAKLRSFFGADPADAPVSMKMDFAYLQFLMHKSKQDIRHEQFIGDWLEAIEKRNGWVSRRRAETILARHREEVVDEVHKQTDPRLQIADARYYIRVGKPLPAAISFAQAAVQDEQSNRSIESAVSSASILQQLSKQAAAAELLLQVAERHPNEGTTPNLFLQAATLLSQTVPAERDKIQAVLQRCLKDWPDTPAAVKARDWMVELTVAEGRTIEAAILATRMPDLHWNMETASRCQNLWLTAATESDDANVVFHTMNTVFDEVTTDVTNPLLVQTKMQLWVLLADDLDRVSKAGTSIDNQFLKELASLRHSPDAQHLSQVRSHVDDSFTQILKWRIERDIEQRPKKAKPLAALLLKTLPNSGLASMRWLILADRVEEALAMMRQRASSSSEPAKWIRVAAQTLSLPSNFEAERKKLAAGLWSELASGYPVNHPKEIEAQVESIRCLFQSGDRTTASAEAELMLLTRPPTNQSQRASLEAIAQ